MIQYAILSQAGERKKNEDTVKVFINQPLSTYGFVLADGLGGHDSGEIASKFVAECAGAAIENAHDFSGIFIDQCFDQSQELLTDEQERTGFLSMKTTMVLLLLTNDEIARWGHIGDSRLYLFRNGKIERQTLDHSVPQMLALSGEIKQQDIRRHPDRGTLLRAMGGEWDFPMYEIDERNFEIRKGDSFLLCSDGFWEWIDEKTILAILKKGFSTHEALQQMAEEVRINGRGQEMDNYSAILINIE